ncbi:STAS domain-containing protein [Kitasatospora sp. NPDC059646]|uniref:STAS domain-containing protein n=1 Tax=Kitasatospora sp. NPDC059646 TaxID=3346893 RepID=UPI0036C104F7
MQWEFERHGEAGVLRLSGFLGERSAQRFRGAFDWAVARCTGPVVIEMSALAGWSRDGEAALAEAAGRLPAERGPLVLCGITAGVAEGLRTCRALSVHPDLATALAGADGSA